MTQFYQLGGAERLDVELAGALNKRGIHTDIISIYSKDLPGAAEAMAVLRDAGIPEVNFLGLSIHPSIISLVPAILKLRRLILEKRYDIIETSLTPPSVLASWATRGTPALHLVGLHQVFQRDRENSKQHLIWRLSALCNHRTRFYAISDYVADRWIRYSRTTRRHIRRIYNGINDVYFTVTPDRLGVRNELGLPEDTRLAIYVGRIAASKGIDIVWDALGPILKQENLVLLYIGLPDLSVKGTKEMLRQLEWRINDQNLSGQVKFLGWRKDIPRLMASAEILVHPTRAEGFGLALVEALAVGLPVAASTAEAIPEILAGSLSVLFPSDDAEKLREAVLEILHRSPVEAARCAESGRIRAEEFRTSRRTDSMIRLFEDMLVGRF